MPASAGSSMPLRLPIAYPIGFFKGSEDVYSKFLTQGDKWQIDTFTAPENEKLFVNPAATSAGGKKRLTGIFRFDKMDGDDGFKSEVQINTDELWQVSAGFYKKVGGDAHRILGEFGYATRNEDGIRRIPILASADGAKKFSSSPAKIGYRVTSGSWMAFIEGDMSQNWQINCAKCLCSTKTFGVKLAGGAKGMSIDAGIGAHTDKARGYLKLSTGAGFAGKTATVLLHPLVDTKTTLGLSCVAKASFDAEQMSVKTVGATVTAAVPGLKGWDWKLNAERNAKGVIKAAGAVVAKLPGKWVMGLCASFDDTSKMGLSDMKLGMRLTQGSTPLPL
eukprot:TRINITY_DN6166_c2_g1_i2.p2 TRINITY_DN6166_c2_g1~~TRINITY_DN6166_c2_g1_i2.p2  ORF type:complete len:357 (+),score=129.15 TRINITY_DN6166_c2_g1_i2:70-1071(+)